MLLGLWGSKEQALLACWACQIHSSDMDINIHDRNGHDVCTRSLLVCFVRISRLCCSHSLLAWADGASRMPGHMQACIAVPPSLYFQAKGSALTKRQSFVCWEQCFSSHMSM